MMTKISERFPWVWALAGAFGVLVMQGVATGQFGAAAVLPGLATAAFLVLAALAQSFAMMTAPGNVDLSIPAVVTLSAFVSVEVVAGRDAMVVPGLLAGLGIGAAVGLANAACILWLRIPAIIATLATGYIVTTLCLLANRQLGTNAIAPLLREAAAGRIAGVPAILAVAGLLAGLAGSSMRARRSAACCWPRGRAGPRPPLRACRYGAS
ncbi:ABC transporter permease subunit [Paracoccus thiocyanatus]|uniref:ABC transporter permease subunit n=1 Tax=Paracoccus thiocyanatus TaxID=34006 RepID=UPI001C6E0B12|nr:hypothetical protein [Paracoccus thiocyanatus]